MNLQLVSRPLCLSPDAAVQQETAGSLGGALIGETGAPPESVGPMQRIFAPLLGSTATLVAESWLTGEQVVDGVSEGIRWRRAGDILYGVLEVDEAEFAAAGNGTPLQAASHEAYRRIFRLLDSAKLPHLWRIWNYLAEINGESFGLERYRQFNVGRQDAFIEGRRGATGNVPAACALGLKGGPLSIAFLAGPTPAVPLENPRQVSAYHYPSEYGPRSPTFSRAALVYPPAQEMLFISGTASIVGHRTVHPGDVAGQTGEALSNVEAVIGEANRYCRGRPYLPGEMSYRVYVRDAADFAVVRASLVERLGEGAEIIYLQADICRADLLIEIEASASHQLGSGE